MVKHILLLSSEYNHILENILLQSIKYGIINFATEYCIRLSTFDCRVVSEVEYISSPSCAYSRVN